MLKQHQIDEFDRDGFLTVGDMLASDEIGELSDALDQVLAKGPDGFSEDEPQPVNFRSLSGDEKHPVWQTLIFGRPHQRLRN